jgi:hypothetical protein
LYRTVYNFVNIFTQTKKRSRRWGDGESHIRLFQTSIEQQRYLPFGEPRTIVDPAGSDDIQPVHLAEALQHRPKLIMGLPVTYKYIGLSGS